MQIPTVTTLHTLADVRSLCNATSLLNVGSERRGGTFRISYPKQRGDINDGVVSLRLVLQLERVPCLPQ